MKAACPTRCVLYLAFFICGCKQSNPSTAPKVEKNLSFYAAEMQLFCEKYVLNFTARYQERRREWAL